MSRPINHFYEFDNFRMDMAKRRLLRDGEIVPLAPKVFETLLVLVEQNGQLVEKDELMAKVWHDVVVEENNLTQNISALRKILGAGNTNGHYIVTVPRLGYRFNAEVKEVWLEDVELVASERTKAHIVFEEITEQSDNGDSPEHHLVVTNEELGMQSANPAFQSQAAIARPATALFINRIAHRKGVVLTVLAVLVIGIVNVPPVWQWITGQSPSAKKSAVPFQQMKMVRLTRTGKVRNAAISPDGNYVAYALEETGGKSLWVRQVATASSMPIVSSIEGLFQGVVFSPDGNYVYYNVYEKDSGASALYQVPVLGGASRKLIVDVDSPVTFSPDGRQFAFVRNNPEREDSVVVIANADGTEEHILATRKLFEGFLWPAWSPDGKTIACVAHNSDADGSYDMVIEVGVEDGTEKRITSQKWKRANRIVWLTDGSGLVMIATDQSSPRQLWHISYPGGEARRITNDLNNYASISLTADSNTIATVQGERISHIWIAPNGDVSRARQITSESGGFNEIRWTPDGKIVYDSNISGNQEIWIMEADGTAQKQLTFDPGADGNPSASADGRYIVFESDRAGVSNIWRMDGDGGNLKKLSGSPRDIDADISPDGKWIVYQGQGHRLWKSPIDGGAPVQLSDESLDGPSISPDGRWIACYYVGEQTNQLWKIALMQFEGRPSIKILDTPLTQTGGPAIRWTPDGRALLYVNTHGGVSNIWMQPLDGNPPKQLTYFKTDQIFSFDWSRDGTLACSRGSSTSDVVLIRNFR